MGVADQADQIRTANVLVRLARNFRSRCIRDQPARIAADPPLVTAGLDWLGGSARRDGRIRVSIAQLFPALAHVNLARAARCHDKLITASILWGF